MTFCYVMLGHTLVTLSIEAHATKKLKAFEMWLYRKILKIPWKARTSNLRPGELSVVNFSYKKALQLI